MLISDAFDLYRRDFIAFKGQSAKTEESYVATKLRLIERFGDADILSLTFDDVRDWKLWLDKGRQPSTVRNYIVCLRVVLRYLAYRGHSVLHWENIPVPVRVNKEMLYLTEEEIEEFISAATQPTRGYKKINRFRNVAIMETLAVTGLRNSELCSLNRTSIKDNTFTVIGKGNKERIGFISDQALASIDKYLAMRTDREPALFLTNSGKRIRTGTIREVFAIACRKSGMDGVHPHTFRHSYATHLLKKRVDIRYVKEFMGHTNLDTTARYTHVINEDLKDIYKKAYANY